MAAAETAVGRQPPQGIGLQMPMVSLYVGDLHPTVLEADLYEKFREMGEIASVRVCKDCNSGKSLCYGYVNFFNPAHASKALACLNHKTLKGKPMRIMWCQRDPLRRKTGVGNLYVKNLGPSISSARLQSMFCKYGVILSCKVAEENGRSKGFGFVQFDTEESAMAALNSLNDTMIEGKKLYVSKFVSKTQRTVCKDSRFTNLFVKNIEEEITEDHLQDKFAEFGKISNAVIMKDNDGKPRGFGFVNFESPEAARKAVEALNGSLMGSKTIFVGRAQSKAEREKLLKVAQEEAANFLARRNASNLYVKNLDLSIDDRILRDHFSSFGIITSAKVMRDNNGLSRGFGFVCFSTSEEAKTALRKLNGMELAGKVLYVAMARQKEERSRQLQNCYPQFQPHVWHPVWNAYSNYYYPFHNDFPIYNASTHSQSIVYHNLEANPNYLLGEENKQTYYPTYVQEKLGNQPQRPYGKKKDWAPKSPVSLTYSTSPVGAGDQNYAKFGSNQRFGFRKKSYNYRQHGHSETISGVSVEVGTISRNAQCSLAEHAHGSNLASMLLEMRDSLHKEDAQLGVFPCVQVN